MKFAMYGSGAAGSVFASYLRKGGADIILIDRYEAHMKKVAEEGMHFTIHQEENGAYHDYNYQLQGFRTYTSAEAAAGAKFAVNGVIDGDDITVTGIDGRTVSPVDTRTIAAAGVYDLTGRKVGDTIENLPKGLYIVSGKKLLVK